MSKRAFGVGWPAAAVMALVALYCIAVAGDSAADPGTRAVAAAVLVGLLVLIYGGDMQRRHDALIARLDAMEEAERIRRVELEQRAFVDSAPLPSFDLSRPRSSDPG